MRTFSPWLCRIGFAERRGFRNLHFRVVGQAVSATHNDLLAAAQAFGDLHAIALANARLHRYLMSAIIPDDHHHGLSLRSLQQRGQWRHDGIVQALRHHLHVDSRARTQPPIAICGLDPYFDGSAVGIERRAHQCDFTLYASLSRRSNSRSVTRLQRGGIALGNVCARGHRRGVHDGQQRRAGRRRLAGITRTIGDHAIDGAANLRVSKLRRGAFVFAFGRGKLSAGRLHLLLLARRLQRRKMLLGHFVLRLGLDQRDRRFVELLAWQSALLEESAAAVINLLLRVVGLLRRLQIEFSLLPLFRQSR